MAPHDTHQHPVQCSTEEEEEKEEQPLTHTVITGRKWNGLSSLSSIQPFELASHDNLALGVSFVREEAVSTAS